MEPPSPLHSHTSGGAGEEIELKLVAFDSDVLDELAGLTELAGYALQAQPTRAIHDRYWDTPGRQLSVRGTSLRIRIEDGVPKFTLKGAGTRDGGLVRHPEFEVAADLNGWHTVRAELERQSLSLPEPEVAGMEPVAWLHSAGLAITQDRRTRRRVLMAEHQGRTIAELALDETAYSLGIYEVLFREVEIESLTGETRHILSLGAALQSTFGERLSPSDRNKYARGLDLARRLA